MISKYRDYTYSVPWNLLIITTGSVIFGIGMKSIAVSHGFITGGMSGVSLLLYYLTGWSSPGALYFLVNVPIFIVAWIYISKRFFFYSLYGMATVSAAVDFINFQIPVHDPMLAVLAGGTIMGAGAGIILHSVGSAGGTDIIGIILNQKFSFRIGTFSFLFNMMLFSLGLGFMDIDRVLYSLALSFVAAQILNYVLSIFNQRKMVLIVSERSGVIADSIMKKLQRGATLMEGRGAYTGKQKEIVLTVVNNYQLKRLEEAVFGIDPDAFVITENTFNVLGKGFSYRKVY